jgi:predicted 3-demethylubiquinone-9 3-methyltransferase (glyoxalase superfamily)
MEKITPCLWFDNEGEEAAHFYVSIFKNSRILDVSRYREGGRGPVGGVMTVTFELDGQKFMALNGGPIFKFTEAISLVVNCEDQAELDEMWAKLSEGGQEVQCGWLKDKYGLSWQIVPKCLGDMITDADPAKSQRVMNALLQMVKLDLNTLKQAYEQESFVS